MATIDERSPAPAAAPAETWPLSRPQVYIWEGMRYRAQTSGVFTSPNIGLAFDVDGPVSAADLRRAARSLVAHHPVLRSRLDSLGPAPQIVLDAADPPPVTVVRIDSPLGDAYARSVAADLVDRERDRPFDLVRGPLWRIVVLEPVGSGPILLVALSHLIADGRSAVAFVKHLARAYGGESLAAGGSYGDFARRTNPVPTDQRPRLDAWAVDGPWSVHASAIAAGVDADRPRLLTEWRRLDFAAGPGLELAHRSLAAAGITPFLVHLSAWAFLLACTFERERLVIGSALAREDLKPEPDALGCYIDFIFIRLAVDLDRRVSDWVAAVRAEWLASLDRLLTVREVLSAEGVQVGASEPTPGTLLFDSWLRGGYLAAGERVLPMRLGDLTLTRNEAPPVQSRGSGHYQCVPQHGRDGHGYLPFLNLAEFGGRRGYIEYNGFQLADAQADALVAAYRRVLEAMARPTRRLTEIRRELGLGRLA